MISELFQTLWLSIMADKALGRTCAFGLGLIIAAGSIWVAYAIRKRWTMIITMVAVVAYIMIMIIMM